jgi:acyl carrier protein
MQEVREEIRRIMAEVLSVSESEVDAAERLQDLPGIESIKVLRVVTKIEIRYKIELDEQVVFSIKTLDELCARVTELRSGGASVARTA